MAGNPTAPKQVDEEPIRKCGVRDRRGPCQNVWDIVGGDIDCSSLLTLGLRVLGGTCPYHASDPEEEDEEADAEEEEGDADVCPGTAFLRQRRRHALYACERGETPLALALRLSVSVDALLYMNRAWYLPDLKATTWLYASTQLLLPPARHVKPGPVGPLLWELTAAPHIGKRVQRCFQSTVVQGRVVAYMPGGPNEALWRVLYDDEVQKDFGEKV
jgi:hypothetical protein